MKGTHVFGLGLLVTLGSVISMAAAAQEPAGRDRPDDRLADQRTARQEPGCVATSG